MTRLGIKTECSVGTAGTAGESALWTYNLDERWDGTSRLAVFLAGHGGGPAQFQQNVAGGLLAAALARSGKYVCVAIQAVGPTAWGNQGVVDAFEAARTAGQTRGAKTGPVLGVGYSMGALGLANVYKQHSDHLAAAVTLAGALDGDWAHSTAGHSPVAGNGTWTTEYEAAFGTYAASAGYRVWDEPASFRSKGVPWLVIHATDDEVVPVSVATSFVSNVNDASVTLRGGSLTGGHTGFWSESLAREVLAFAEAGAW